MLTQTKQTATQSQKLMIFVLSMSLYGLATLFTELIPSVQVGVVEFSVEFFLFIPLTLAMLFDPLSAALGAATGELVFSEIMLGQFGGLGELEKFLTVTIGVYIAGRLVKDPKNRRMVGVAAIVGTAAQLAMGTVVDILKVQFAVEDFEAVAGLPESVFATEGFAFCNDLLFSGILFCLLPTLYLVPKLYGKIEPLLGMAPPHPGQRRQRPEPQGPAGVRHRLCLRHRGGDGRHRRHVPGGLGGQLGRERHRPGGGHPGGRGGGPGCPAGDQEDRRQAGRGGLRCTPSRSTS